MSRWGLDLPIMAGCEHEAFQAFLSADSDPPSSLNTVVEPFLKRVFTDNVTLPK